MIIPRIKYVIRVTPLLMAVIIGNFQICNTVLLDCFNWPFMIMARLLDRCRSDYLGGLFLMMVNQKDTYE